MPAGEHLQSTEATTNVNNDSKSISSGSGSGSGIDDGPSVKDDWLVGVTVGSKFLARFHDRVWYEAVAEADPASADATGARSVLVRFKGFEADGQVSVPFDHANLAPVDIGADGLPRGGDGSGACGGGPAESVSDESELEDAWADAYDVREDERQGGTFFQERVLGEPSERARGCGVSKNASVRTGKGSEELYPDAYVFGDWEQHTKGFGSRMMSKMGYRRGEGLGKDKQVSFVVCYTLCCEEICDALTPLSFFFDEVIERRKKVSTEIGQGNGWYDGQEDCSSKHHDWDVILGCFRTIPAIFALKYTVVTMLRGSLASVQLGCIWSNHVKAVASGHTSYSLRFCLPAVIGRSCLPLVYPSRCVPDGICMGFDRRRVERITTFLLRGTHIY